MSTFVLPLADPEATLETVGGKGLSLAKMALAGLPVPGGFHVTTEAYRRFVDENQIQPRILSALEGADQADTASLEAISQQITRRFIDGTIPPEIVDSITAAYASFAPAVVAVRSSATAEDLPGASFAGQQETYLNICGIEDVLSAVKKCWASLWTARAIAYRARQNISPDTVALAVVVQALIFADASGVLFTANPVTRSREEMMLTATWGLGEAIVGGLVTPDTLILSKVDGRVLQREISEKQVMTIRAEAGTREQPVAPGLQKKAVLSDAQAFELEKLGERIEQLYGTPMDIEWAIAEGRLAVLQARPVTTLTTVAPDESVTTEPPLKWERANTKTMLARGSFAEFLPDPVSPLFATLAVPIAREASERLMQIFLNIKGKDSYVFEVVNGYVFVGMAMTPEMIYKSIFTSIGQSKKLLRSGRERWAVVQAKSQSLAQKWQVNPETLPASDLLSGAREIFGAVAEYYTVGQSGPIAAAPMSEFIFSRFYKTLIKQKQDPAPSIFMVGFDTLPLRAEKSLYDLSMWVKAQPELAEAILQTPVEAICAALKASPVPAPFAGEFSNRFAAHLAEFGHTLYDLDFAKPVPVDDPSPLIDTMKGYLSGKGINPYNRQQAQVARREQAEQAILRRLDPLRRKWFTQLLHWAQGAGPDRENCIADMGVGYPQLRRLLGELGRRLAAGGAVMQAEDVYWLEAQEADELAACLDSGEVLPSYIESVERRKAFWRQMRRVSPPIALPEKTFFAKLLVHDNPSGSKLKGYAASAGKVTARACVLRGPEEFSRMQPGDVIVAVTTTPAWTPLFAMASAVVTDIGGPLSHSSIVAREYGIPAVMATGVASKRIKHGQLISVDGGAGTVEIMDGV